MNTSPGMTGHSLVPSSAKAAGIAYEALCLRLLATAALDSAAERPPLPGAAADGSRQGPSRKGRGRRAGN